jgi:thymidylate synthase (FAD)
MQVKVVSISQSLVDGVDSAEELLVYIARVSNPSNQGNLETAPRLLRYLIDHKHWSPFDMANLCVEVKTSRAIAQQILRHWSIKPQEFSQRYAEVVEVEDVEIRKQGATNRQGGEEEFNPYLEKFGWSARAMIDKHIETSQELYKELISAGVAKESARFILPLATQTTMYLNGSIRSWIHYLEQRLDAHAQKEHRLIAQEIEQIFKSKFPNVWEAIQMNK